ncbi:uncharacterized protein V6R79_020123 [Siganus canaliculatus]
MTWKRRCSVLSWKSWEALHRQKTELFRGRRRDWPERSSRKASVERVDRHDDKAKECVTLDLESASRARVQENIWKTPCKIGIRF